MAIPEAQLDTWSKPGSQTQSKDTYATIKGALEASDAAYSGRSCSSFLQGSYGNDTNVYADSDVDVVMKVGSIYYYDLSRLSPAEQAAFNAALGSGAAYSFQDFRRDVIAVLKKKFDSCGFFHHDPSSGKAGTATEDIDHTSRTLLPVI